MVVAAWANIKVLAELFMKDHGIAAFTFNP
jgi:hypothetical protein